MNPTGTMGPAPIACRMIPTVVTAAPVLQDATTIQTVLASGLNGQFYVIGNPTDVIGTVSGVRTLAPRTEQMASMDMMAPTLTTTGITFAHQSVARDQKRRATHNEVERRRRDNINTWITRLGKMIPEGGPDSPAVAAVVSSESGGKSSSSSQSKGGILAKACDYIRDLTRSNRQLQEQLDQGSNPGSDEHTSLLQQIEELRQENEMLKNTLESNGILVPTSVEHVQTQMDEILSD